MALPSGTVTFLLTDIEGSTQRWEADPDGMRAGLAAHDEVLQAAIEGRGGLVFKHTGDGVCAAFSSATAAVEAAIDAQQRLALPVRMGLVTGSAEVRDGDYFGPALNRAARVMAAGHGGQIVVAASTAALVDGFDLIDLGEHRLRDLPGSHRLFQVCSPGLRSEFPSLRTLDAAPGNLPVQPTSLIGRDAELVAVVTAVRAHRLVTLTGVGGVGKTRLAVQAAACVRPTVPDGAWLVELAAVSDEKAVAHAVAAALGIAQRSGLSMMSSVASALSSRHALLVLDNCEHVLDAVCELVELLVSGAPNVSILATSREGLGVAGERLWPVSSLSTAEGSGSPAVMLFVERAQAVLPGFELASGADVVVDVCRRLDGIPLAIELAAARIRSMSPAQIRDRLDDRFQLLTGGSRLAMQRHKTLRHTVQWSYDLLSEPDRRVLCRAAVFAGGFTLRAAEAVCSQGMTDADVLDVLDSLVRKSLVTVDHADEVRYALMETIREFAEEQLLARGDVESSRNGHAEYFASEAEANRDRFASPEQKAACEWVHTEFANLRAAFRWTIDRHDLATAIRIVVGAREPASLGLRYEPVEWAEEILEQATRARVRSLPSLLATAARCAQLGRVREAVNYGQTAAAMVNDAEFDPDPHAFEHVSLAIAYLYDGQPEKWIEVSAAGAQRDEDRRMLINRCAELWGLAAFGQEAKARRIADKVVAAARTTGIPWTIALALHGYGRAFADSDPARALAAKREALSLAQDSGNRWGHMVVGAELAALEARHGEPQVAVEFFDEVITWLDEAGDVANLTGILGWVVVLLDRMGRLEAAATLYGIERERLLSVTWVDGLDDTVKHLDEALGTTHFQERMRTGAAMHHQGVQYAHEMLRQGLNEIGAA